jgi:hypothetical protein
MKVLLLLALGLGISPFRAADDDFLGPSVRPVTIPTGPITEVDGRCEAGYDAGAEVPLGGGLVMRVLRHGEVLALCVELPRNHSESSESSESSETVTAYFTSRNRSLPIDLTAAAGPGEDGELELDLGELGTGPLKVMVEVKPKDTAGGGDALVYPPGARYDSPRTWMNWRILPEPGR